MGCCSKLQQPSRAVCARVSRRAWFLAPEEPKTECGQVSLDQCCYFLKRGVTPPRMSADAWRRSTEWGFAARAAGSPQQSQMYLTCHLFSLDLRGMAHLCYLPFPSSECRLSHDKFVYRWDGAPIFEIFSILNFSCAKYFSLADSPSPRANIFSIFVSFFPWSSGGR